MGRNAHIPASRHCRSSKYLRRLQGGVQGTAVAAGRQRLKQDFQQSGSVSDGCLTVAYASRSFPVLQARQVQASDVAAAIALALTVDEDGRDLVAIEKEPSVQRGDGSRHEKVETFIGDLADLETRLPALSTVFLQMHAHQRPLDKGRKTHCLLTQNKPQGSIVLGRAQYQHRQRAIFDFLNVLFFPARAGRLRQITRLTPDAHLEIAGCRLLEHRQWHSERLSRARRSFFFSQVRRIAQHQVPLLPALLGWHRDAKPRRRRTAEVWRRIGFATRQTLAARQRIGFYRTYLLPLAV